MSNKWKIVLSVLIVSGLVFAAVETKFYGNINLQNNKIVNLGTPTANGDGANKSYVDTAISGLWNTYLPRGGGSMSGSIYMGSTHRIKNLQDPTDSQDAVTKAYADTKLPLSGGTMLGGLDMNGYRISSVGTPYYASDVGTKDYVDNKTAQSATSSGYQYFGLKKGSNFTPLYNLDSNTNYWLTFTVLKEFYGYPILWAEGMDATITNFNHTVKTYKVGDTFKAQLYISGDTSYRTNGSVIVKGGDGIVGNFGITFPPTATPQFKVYVGEDLYNQNTAASLVGKFDGSGNIKVGITNITAITGNIGVKCPKAKLYVNDGERVTTIMANGTPYTAPSTIATTILGKKCEWITVNFGIDPETGGVRWNFDLLVTPAVTNNFGQFYLYSN